MATNRWPPAVGVGTNLLMNVESPSCPFTLSPQQYEAPSLLSAQLNCCPTATATDTIGLSGSPTPVESLPHDAAATAARPPIGTLTSRAMPRAEMDNVPARIGASPAVPRIPLP